MTHLDEPCTPESHDLSAPHVIIEMINIGTLSAFITVSLGIIVLRRKRPDLTPAFRVPFGSVIPIASAALCLYLMFNLATVTWLFFAVWLIIGFGVYFAYGYRHSRLRARGPVDA